MEDITKYLEAEKNCVQMITQFLRYNDFSATLSVFTKEVESLDYQYRLSEDNFIIKDHIKRNCVDKIISAFQSTDHDTFFKEWSALIPKTIKEVPDYKKLTFYLHVHFAIIPFRNIQESRNETSLKAEEKKDKLSGNFIKNENDVQVAVQKDETIPREVKRLDVIRETTSPSQEYDTDSLDQSSVLIGEGNSEQIIPKTGMEALKSFLSSEGEIYSSQKEFLPFFALPYVSEPENHESFKDLFQEKWLNSMNLRFYNFIHKYSCSLDVAPKIVKLCEEHNMNEISKLKVEDSNTSSLNSWRELLRRYKQSRRRFNKLHKDHQNLIGVATELTAALEQSVRGQAVDLRATLNTCALIFPELFNKSSNNSFSRRLKESAEHQKGYRLLCYSELDVHKIKSHLLSASMKTKLLLLQAIRWRITQGSSEERDQAIAWMSRHDVLSLHNDEAVRSMLRPSDMAAPHPLQQGWARLLNATASLRAGRDYLASSHTLLQQLVSSLHQEADRMDSVTSDMLLATMQKLSLRKSSRLAMIEQGVVEWLVAQLDSKWERLYTVEYSAALLLNLLLHEEARQHCPDSTLQLLADLLQSGPLQIIPMITGSLCCLLSQENLNKKAREMNLDVFLMSKLDTYAEMPQISLQIKTLLKLMRGELPKESILTVSDESSEDDLDDPDDFEAELDADDPVKPVGDDQYGEVLLQHQYQRIFPSQGVVCPNRAGPSEIYILPSTPSSYKHSAKEISKK